MEFLYFCCKCLGHLMFYLIQEFKIDTNNGSLSRTGTNNGSLFKIVTNNGSLFRTGTINGSLFKIVTNNGSLFKWSQVLNIFFNTKILIHNIIIWEQKSLCQITGLHLSNLRYISDISQVNLKQISDKLGLSCTKLSSA